MFPYIFFLFCYTLRYSSATNYPAKFYSFVLQPISSTRFSIEYFSVTDASNLIPAGIKQN